MKKTCKNTKKIPKYATLGADNKDEQSQKDFWRTK
jgi:hypothetical protein